MKWRNFINTLCLLISLNLLTTVAIAHENRSQTLVLVTASNSPVNKLPPGQFRKLFLDVPVKSNGQLLVPLINMSDDLLYEIFLQKVVYMSKRHYERMLISKTFRTGRPRPARFDNNEELVKALKTIPGAVSIMWEKTARKNREIKIVQVIWEERH